MVRRPERGSGRLPSPRGCPRTSTRRPNPGPRTNQADQRVPRSRHNLLRVWMGSVVPLLPATARRESAHRPTTTPRSDWQSPAASARDGGRGHRQRRERPPGRHRASDRRLDHGHQLQRSPDSPRRGPRAARRTGRLMRVSVRRLHERTLERRRLRCPVLVRVPMPCAQ